MKTAGDIARMLAEHPDAPVLLWCVNDSLETLQIDDIELTWGAPSMYEEMDGTSSTGPWLCNTDREELESDVADAADEPDRYGAVRRVFLVKI